MKSALALIVALGLLSGAAQAQETYLSRGADLFGHSAGDSQGSGGRSLFGLVGSDHLKISNETSFSVLSGGSGSFSQGVNVTRLTYNSGSPLSLSMGVGNVFMSSGSYLGYSAKPGFFLHDVSLQYKAGEHSVINFQFMQSPLRRTGPRLIDRYGYDVDPMTFGH